MYYGKSSSKYDTTPETGLHVLTRYNTSTDNAALIFTKDLSTWTVKRTFALNTYLGKGTKGISQYMFIDTQCTSGSNKNYRYRVYLLMPGYFTNTNSIPYTYTTTTNLLTSTWSNKTKATTAWVACCRKSETGLAIFVSQSGEVAVFNPSNAAQQGGISNTDVIRCGISVNPGSAAYIPSLDLFCVAGASGTATSPDGSIWATHADAAKNLMDLCYREDIPESVVEGGKGIVGWSNDDKHFYASNNGKDWVRMSVSPIPLSTVAAVDYNPDLKWYCAIGGTSQYVYFTKDLKTWIPTQVSSVAIPMGSVIWMPSTQKYVLVPATDNSLTYYTFAPSEWRDE